MAVAWVREEEVTYDGGSSDQDGLWKKVLGDLFEDFVLFFSPDLHAQIDFKQYTDFLDKELFQEIADEKRGRRFADRLAKVRMKNGQDQ